MLAFNKQFTKYIHFSAFDARVQSKVINSADYYLHQHLEGEPKELISGCLHIKPKEGYKEAQRMLEKEYGDP